MAKATCLVIGCNCTGTHKISIDRRGGRNGFLCDFHWSNNDGYGTRNGAIVGTSKKHSVMIGREFEMSYADDKARHEFSAMQAIPTRDSSLHDFDGRGKEVEFVFPTECGLNKVSKDSASIQKLMDAGSIEINRTCGTHLHVSTAGTRSANGMDYVRRFYNSLFVPLTEAMQAHPDATTALFGRYFTDYAPVITMNTRQQAGHNGTRYVWVNCTNSNRIEFRLVRFRNAEQYMRAVKLCVEITKCVDKNFIQHFNDTPKDSNRYPTKTEYRRHKAQMTANKLVKLFLKAIEQ